MPPPELLDRAAPDSAGSIVLEQARIEAPVSRHVGARADEAYWRGQLDEMCALGDEVGERQASVALARVLAARGTDLDTAVSLAERALELGEDASLRADLAGWLSGLGQHARAAQMWLAMVQEDKPQEAARILVKAAVLFARAQEAQAAVEALERAARLDAHQPMANEILGTLAGWEPPVVAPEAAAASFLDAASRREAAKEREATFEDRLRAFEIAPHDEAAASSLAGALAARGKHGAGDEVLRWHAAIVAESNPEQAFALHHKRMLTSLLAGDYTSAVGAMLDGWLDGDVESDASGEVDELLSKAGLYDLLAVRLQCRADKLQGEARAFVLQSLAELYAGPLEHPDEAAEIWVEVLACDPDHPKALDSLRAYAIQRRDYGPLADALIRVGEGVELHGPPKPDAPRRAELLKVLVSIADKELKNRALASWAEQRLSAAAKREDKAADASRGRAARTQSIMMRSIDPEEDDAMAAAVALDSASTLEQRIEALRRLANIYAGRPHVRAEYMDVLAELSAALPGEKKFVAALERLAFRTGDFEPLDKVMRAWIEDGAEGEELVRARLWLTTLTRRKGDEAFALEQAAPLLVEAPTQRRALCAVLFAAARVGDAERRADALVRLAGVLKAPVRAAMLAVASDLYAAIGSAELSVRAAELSAEADTSYARAFITLAAMPIARPGRAHAALLERAIGATVPRASSCEVLSAHLEARGETGLALAWTQRWVALRPGCPRAIMALVDRACSLSDAQKITEALAWVLAQPKPPAELEPGVTKALGVLARIDRVKALKLARKALDGFGPDLSGLRAELLKMADEMGDQALAISALERWLSAAEVPDEQAASVLLDLSDRRLRARDYDGAARELVRALDRGGDIAELLSRAENIESAMRERGSAPSSDALISIGALRARVLVTINEADAQHAAGEAWRRMAGLWWDLAFDRRSADAAFFLASQLLHTGPSMYARDLCSFAGAEDAITMLVARAETLTDAHEQKSRAALYIEAANLANAASMPAMALSLASSAIDIDPTRSDAVVLIERAAQKGAGIDVLDQAYERLANAALGSYGKKAAHYRASRQLERRGAEERALHHAVACFEAFPGVGHAFALLVRLAERTGQTADVVRVIQRAAENSPAEERADWYKRAASVAALGRDGAALRFEMLLNALHISPERRTVDLVSGAIRELLKQGTEAETIAMRFERAISSVLKRLEGPEGVRTAIALAQTALRVLGNVHIGTLVIEAALEIDGDLEEYTALNSDIPALARNSAEANRLLDTIQKALAKPYSSIGVSVLAFAGKLAAAMGRPKESAVLLLQAIRRDPDIDELVCEADSAVHDLHDADLLLAFDQAVPAARRLEALLQLSEQRERQGREQDVVPLLERALLSPELHGEARDQVVTRLRRRLSLEGKSADIEALLRTELKRSDHSPLAKQRMARDLASILTAQGDHRAAFDIFAAALSASPIDASLLEELRHLGRRLPDRERHVNTLSDLATRVRDNQSRVAVLTELSDLLEELGRADEAIAFLKSAHELAPNHIKALEGLERDAAAHADHETVAALLAQRIALLPPEQQRTLRLRRAAVLEQRLGRVAEAITELETLLENDADDRSALRFLSDIFEHQKDANRALPLFMRLVALSDSPEEKAEYAQRAANASLEAGDLDTARAVVNDAEAYMPEAPLLVLRCNIARRAGQLDELADGLEALSAMEDILPGQKAQMLLEASEAASAAGKETRALELVRKAFRLAPDEPGCVLEAARLEYRMRDSISAAARQGMLEHLVRIEPLLAPHQIDLHTFLLAEALDAASLQDRAVHLLVHRSEEETAGALIQLGMAQRLVKAKKWKEALPLFETALHGDLHGIRTRGQIALEGAEAAVSSGDLDTSVRFLNMAASEPDTKDAALRRTRDITKKRPAESAPASAAAPPASASPSSTWTMPAGHEADEAALLMELVAGSFEAGEQLIAIYKERRTAHTQDILTVRKHQAALLPGDESALQQLREAALADGNHTYAHAIEHVLSAFNKDAENTVLAPPLSAHHEAAEHIKSLLIGTSATPVHEALSIVWETGVYRRDIAQCGLSGVPRLIPGGGSSIAELWGAVGRALGLARTALFFQRSSSAPALSVLPLSPPGVLLSGDAQGESTELAYLFGSAAVGAMPEHVLVNALPETVLLTLLNALIAAFGPVGEAPQRDPAVVRLGQNLWQLIPPRGARRLHEICSDPSRINPQAALSGTRRIMRRAGLFACGDLRIALQQTVEELKLDTTIDGLNALRQACEAHPALADLVKLATSSEYADARFYAATTHERR